MNTNTKAQRPVTTLLYPETLALSVYAFAYFNTDFKELLEKEISGFSATLPCTQSFTIDSPFVHVLPKDSKSALLRTRYILEHHKTPETLQILNESIQKKPYSSPQSVVLGISIGVLPVGFFGLHKRKSEITTIIRSDMEDLAITAQHTSNTSLRLVEQAIREASFRIKKIEPELAEWFFGEKKINLYQGNLETLAHIKKELQKLDVPFSYTEDEGGINCISISPAINSDTLSLTFDVEKIDKNI